MAESNEHQQGRGLAGTLLRNPATDQLMHEARSFLAALGQKAVRQVGERLGSATETLGPAADGIQKLAAGESTGKAATSTALSALKQKVKGVLGGGGGVGSAGGSGEPGPPKVTHIAESIDVAVPVSTAYDQWTQFKDFSTYMKGVEGVDPKGETEQNWRVKVFKSRRTWQGKTLEQIPDRRIKWTTEGAKGTTKGAVTFHPLVDDLTRVVLTIEYYPSGFMEKTGNLWRAGGRRARLDLKNFRRFITIRGEATGSWRGEIRDGEVVRQPDEEPREMESEEARDEAETLEGNETPTSEDEDEDRELETDEPRDAGASDSSDQTSAEHAPDTNGSGGENPGEQESGTDERLSPGEAARR
jgi:uncharacterized membrane protein